MSANVDRPGQRRVAHSIEQSSSHEHRIDPAARLQPARVPQLGLKLEPQTARSMCWPSITSRNLRRIEVPAGKTAMAGRDIGETDEATHLVGSALHRCTARRLAPKFDVRAGLFRTGTSSLLAVQPCRKRPGLF